MTRRMAIAITAAAASTTVAIGVTLGSLLGWFGPAARATDAAPTAPASDPAPASAPIIYVPIAPVATPPAAAPTLDPSAARDVTFVMNDDADEHERHGRHQREHEHEHEGDDDD
jgi:hypothetical protein